MTTSSDAGTKAAMRPIQDIADRLSQIQGLAMDVDGVLTDGTITYLDSGEEIKAFNAKDGLGIRLIQDAGIPVAIITGRSSQALHYRCNNLGISFVYENAKDKKSALDHVCADVGIAPHAFAFIGDDLPDLVLKNFVGLFIAVADAHEILLKRADWVTDAKGGKGAVREVCESILKAKGIWQQYPWAMP